MWIFNLIHDENCIEKFTEVPTLTSFPIFDYYVHNSISGVLIKLIISVWGTILVIPATFNWISYQKAPPFLINSAPMRILCPF